MIHKALFYLSIICTCIMMPVWGHASTSLLADRIEVDKTKLIATGNVTIWLEDEKITAHTLIYDQSSQHLTLHGPIVVTTADGSQIFSSNAELNSKTHTAILHDARMVLEDRLQFEADTIRRPYKNTTEMFKVAMTSCNTCRGKTPIWQIRAKKITHDRVEKQVYLESAQLRFFGVPVMYLPWVRMPDPSLKRATGFLTPKLQSNTLLGSGIKIPYFIALGDHRDLTLTPYISSKTNTLEYRYRQALSYGNIYLNGALTRDRIVDGLRGYIDFKADFILPRDYELSFVAQATKDTSYLREYGYSSRDRLQSYALINRSRSHGHTDIKFSHYKSLRSSENNATIPTIVFEGTSEHRFQPDIIGGQANVAFNFQNSYRYSDNNVDGFDMLRISLTTQWNKNWITPIGIVTDVAAQASIDQYFISQHIIFPRKITNSASTAAVAFSYPMKAIGRETRQLLTPKIQVQWAHINHHGNPNQDSTHAEFDEGNLFALERSAGYELTDQGHSITAGLDWEYWSNAGQHVKISFGRIWRDKAVQGFTKTSGLSGKQSDWMIGAQWTNGSGLDMIARATVDDTGSFSKFESHVNLMGKRYFINTSYSYLSPDISANRSNPVSDLALQSTYKLNENWTLSNSFRYNFQTSNITQAQAGLNFQNECIDVNLSVTRRYASTRSSNDYALTVGLLGFGKGPVAQTRTTKTCRG